MIALFVNGAPTLIDTPEKVNKKVDEVLAEDPEAEIEKTAPCRCGSCGSLYFDDTEAIFCACHDNY